MSETTELTKTGPLGDEAKVGKMRDRDAVAKEQEKADIKHVMGHPAGRRFVAWLVGVCEVGSVPFFELSVRHGDFVMGHQNVGHRVVALAREHCLNEFRLMEDEVKSWQEQQKLR